MLSNNWGVAGPVRDYLDSCETVISTDKNINEMVRPSVDIIVSYCYRHILKPDVLKEAPAVNLHNSFLPWGRGAQPLFWSVVDGEPCGVSIHWMDAGLDTGEVIARQRVDLHEEMTMRQAYEAQHRVLSQLFMQHWHYIREKVGTYHTTADFRAVEDVLGPAGWDTKIGDVRRRWRA